MKTIIKIPHNFFEKKAWAQQTFLCGIDEAGRGSLAGPIVVAAVVLPQNTPILFKDSKKTTLKERLEYFDWLNEHAYHAITFASHSMVDKHNVYQATLSAAQYAYITLANNLAQQNIPIATLITDALPVKFSTNNTQKIPEIHYFPYGESISTTIAAASIIAKVTRDRFMETMEHIFPDFSFGQHKGYGTKKHILELQTKKPSIIHRQSFIKTIIHKDDYEHQTTLFTSI